MYKSNVSRETLLCLFFPTQDIDVSRETFTQSIERGIRETFLLRKRIRET